MILLLAADLAFMLLLAVSWGIPWVRVGGFAAVADQSQLPARARSLLATLVIGILFSIGKIATTCLLAFKGWLFVKDAVPVQLLLVAAPAVAVLVFSVPRLWTIARSGSDFSRTKTETEVLNAAAPVAVPVPIQAAGFGALTDLLWVLFYRDKTLNLLNAAAIIAIFAAAVLLERRLRMRRAFRLAVRTGVLAIAVASWYWLSAQSAVLPDRQSMMSSEMDLGGGTAIEMGSHQDGMSGSPAAGMAGMTGMQAVSVTDLRGPQTGVPDKRFTLTAEKKRVRLREGVTVDAWTFDGQLPGPELRVKQGDLIEVTLINKDIEEGVTLHWHGLDVPNGEDGVAGVTQDAVMPGQSFTYRFRAEQAGSYWYHSHQDSLEAVQMGLFGALIVEPASSEIDGKADVKDITVMDPSWKTTDGSEARLLEPIEQRKLDPGTKVRLRLFNTGDWPKTFSITGAKFKVAAIDGTELNAPTDLENVRLELGAGGRYDVTFTMPDTPVLVSDSNASGILFSADGKAEAPKVAKGPIFDPASYGSPTATPFGAGSKFDREFVMVMDNKLGFYDGKFERLFTINGEVFPNTPMLMVREGDLVKTTFVNRSFVPHPMHLHGHHMLVLSKNGKPVTGSPWWTDTLNVDPGEIYEVAFVADNPGVWMDHCHNLEHAAIGMTLHLAYEGVTSPFEVGHATINRPE